MHVHANGKGWETRSHGAKVLTARPASDAHAWRASLKPTARRNHVLTFLYTTSNDGILLPSLCRLSGFGLARLASYLHMRVLCNTCLHALEKQGRP